MKFTRTIGEGEMYPRGYGIAWWRWDHSEAVCLPVPLNIIVRAARIVWYWMKAPWPGISLERRIGRIRHRSLITGKAQGWNDGFVAGRTENQWEKGFTLGYDYGKRI